MRDPFKWTALISLFFYSFVLSAQKKYHQHYTVDDGLPSSNVYCVNQDSAGYIWIGTDKGLARFDGYEFEKFTKEDGLDNREVWNIEIDKNNRMWLGCFNDVIYYKNGEFHKMKSDLLDIMVQEIWLDSFGHIFLNVDRKGIYTIEKDSVVLAFDKFNSGFIRSTADGTNYFTLRPSSNITQWFFSLQKQDINGKVDTIVETNEFITLEHNFWNGFYEDDEYIIFTQFRILRIKDGKITFQSFEAAFGENFIINELNKLSGGDLLLHTTKGKRVINSQLEYISKYDFLNEFQVNRIFQDRGNNIWISSGDGLYFISESMLESKMITFGEKPVDNKVLNLAQHRDGSIWAGTYNGGIFRIQGDTVKELKLKQFQLGATKRIVDITFDAQDNLYFGGDFGVTQFSKAALATDNYKLKRWNSIVPDKIPYSYNLFGRNVKFVKKMPTGDILVDSNAGTFCLKNDYDLNIKYLRRSYFKRNYVGAGDKAGNIWLGGKYGMTYFDFKQDSIINLYQNNPFFAQPINDLEVDQNNYLWIATEGNGLFRFKNGVIDTIKNTEKEVISNLYIDNDNRIWTATNQGVRKITVKNESPFTYEIQAIRTAHGLTSDEVNDVLYSNGNIYAGTINGLNILQDREIFEYTEKPSLYLSEIKVNGKTVPMQDTFYLPYNKNNLHIKYICISYKSARKNTYFYQMDGIDQEEQSTTSLERAYPVLPPGTYTFHLRAKDIGGLETEKKYAITFIIAQPWWLQWWFIVSTIVVSIGSIVWYISNRIRRVRRIETQKNEVNQKFAELELQALQAQMNPHFIFNALHAIQDFIFKKDERTANHFIVKFSRLMRLFLESSKEKYILLSDEIQLITHYMDLEKLRFEDKFDYELDVTPTLKASMLEIPSMLLQPYIENAINHGLVQRKEKGQLIVQIYEENKNLYCIVQDDGIGREKAAKLREKSYKSYKSRGMEIVAERLKVLNYISKSNIELNIEDLYTKEGIAAGTKVKIKIPLDS